MDLSIVSLDSNAEQVNDLFNLQIIFDFPLSARLEIVNRLESQAGFE